MAKKSSNSENERNIASTHDDQSSVHSWNSQELLFQVQQRNSRAATEVFDRYVARLLALARARMSPRLRQRIDADDIVQSVYRSFFVRAECDDFVLSESGDLWRLLARITLHKLYHQIERHNAARRNVRHETTADSFVVDVIDAPGPTPAEAIALVEQLHLVAKQLNEAERCALSAHLQGESIEQIAITFRKSPRTVRRLLETSRQKIEGALKSEDDSARRRTDAPRYCTAHPLATLRYSDYVLDRLIGAGGMGKVYRATQRSTGDTVAIKALPKSRQADSRVIEKFLQEAQILARLNHPNIVGFRGVGRFPGGGHFIAMEFIDGTNLQSRIDRGPIAIDEAVRIAQTVATAIAYAHEQRIVHGDLKPANVLQGNDARVVVSDFGLAHFIAERAEPPVTRWLVGGTAGYIAPEVRAHGEPPAAAADVYGLGAFLWALVTGAPPDDMERCSHPTVPTSIVALCAKCLIANPADRFHSAQDLLRALSAIGT